MRLHNGIHLQKRKLVRGNLYWVTFVGRYSGKPRYKWCLCRFIQVTRKGFNFLDLETSKCMTYHHFYPKNFGGKELPKDRDKFVFWIPDCMSVQEFEINET